MITLSDVHYKLRTLETLERAEEILNTDAKKAFNFVLEAEKIKKSIECSKVFGYVSHAIGRFRNESGLTLTGCNKSIIIKYLNSKQGA